MFGEGPDLVIEVAQLLSDRFFQEIFIHNDQISRQIALIRNFVNNGF
jgi:hypothetical protein